MSQPTVPDEMPESEAKLWRPFLRLGKYLTEEFLKLAEHWLFLVSEYGMSKTPTEPKSKEEWQAFFVQCHDGWKQAQTEIASFLIDALDRLEKTRQTQKEQHRLKNKEGQRQAKFLLHQIGLEISVARRMLDTILWTILHGEHATLRRLPVVGGQHSLSVANIKEAMRVADQLNADPLTIALSTDMLSLVHVGDLLVANRKTGEVTFVELKAGEKNAQIASFAEFAVRSGCGHFEQLATADFDQTDKKHYERVKRQAVRNETIMSTIRNEGGIDPNTGATVVIRTTPDPVEVWSECIQAGYESLQNGKKWAIDCVDDCLYVGVYADQAMAFMGFQAWMKGQQCESRIYNLADSFRRPSVRPLGAAFLSSDLRQKILRGDIIVVICLDIQKFIELGNSMAPGAMRFATPAEAKARDHRMSYMTFAGKSVVFLVNGQVHFAGAGLVDRIIFDQQSPSQILAQRLAIVSSTTEQPGTEHGGDSEEERR